MPEEGSSPERTPRPSRSRDARIDAFLRRAAPILAAERGLTPTCKLKLQALADEMALPADLREKAIQALQSGQASGEADRWEKAFADYVESRLKSHRGEILNLDVERRAVKVAETRFRLQAQRAREIFSETTKRLGIRRITATEAERHVEITVRDLIADATWVDSTMRERLVGIGAEWGVAAQHVLAMVELRLRLNRDRVIRDRRRVQAMIAMVSIASISALSYVGYHVYQRLEASRNTEQVDTTNNTDSTVATAPSWWSEDTRSAMGAAMARLPGLKVEPRNLGSSDPSVREQALDQLAIATVDRHDQPESRARLEALLRGLCIDEPEEPVFDHVADDLLTAARSPREGLPSGDDFYRRAVATIRILAELASHPQLKPDRRTRLEERLGKLTGTLVLPSPEDSARVHIQDYLSDAFRRLIAVAAKDPATTMTRFGQLESVANTEVSPERQAAWATELLESLLRNAPDSWETYRSLIDRCSNSSYRDQAPALVNLLESSEENEALLYLANRLRESYRVTPVDESLPEIAAALRRELGIGATGGSNASLVRRSLADAAAQAAAFDPLDSNTNERLDALAALMFHGTLAMELALHPEQIDSVRNTLTAGPPKIAPTPTTETPGLEEEEEPSSFASREADRVTDRIQDLGSASSTTAVSILRMVGQRLSDGLSLEGHPDAERRLAAFLLKSRRDEELREILDVVPPLVEWRGLGLALVDALERPGTDLKVAEQILLEWGDNELSLNESESQVISLQRRFLLLISNPPKPVVSMPKDDEESRVATQSLPSLLQETYQRRSHLIRTSTVLEGTMATDGAPTSPGAAAMLTVAAWIRSTESTSTEDTSSVDLFLRRQAADELLVTDDAERLVAAQSLLIDAVTPWIAQRFPERKVAAMRSRDAYREVVASREDRLLQLLDGERTLLSLWMLAR